MKARLRQNILLFVFGLLLWAMVFFYLRSHPGERASLLPSLTMLGQKIQGLGYTLLGKNSNIITIKSGLAKNFDELEYLIKSNPDCNNPELLQRIEVGKKQLNSASYDAIQSQQYSFYSLAIQIKTDIEQQCGKK